MKLRECNPQLLGDCAYVTPYIYEQLHKPMRGFFGAAVATMGTLSSEVFVLTMDFFGTESGREVTVPAPAPDPIAAATNDEVGHMMTVDTVSRGFLQAAMNGDVIAGMFCRCNVGMRVSSMLHALLE